MTIQSIEDACRSACISIGVDYKPVPYDGQFHTADLTDDPKGRSDSRIKVFPDRQGGIVWNHKSGEQRLFFVNDSRGGSGEPINPVDREHIQREQQYRKIEQQARQDKAALKAQAIWKSSQPSPLDHPYLTRKHVKAYGTRGGSWSRSIKDEAGKYHKIIIKNCLILPLYDQGGAIRSLQAIFPEKSLELDRDRDFMPGGGVAGLFWWIGAKSDTVLICEGFATAATLREDTGYRVYMAFTANNLLAVGRVVRAALPDARIVFCADNDVLTPGNPGITKAAEAAQAVDGYVAVPPIHGDFNDYAIHLKEFSHDQ